MSEHTAISWCDSTFNPWVGCTKVSPACDHCYAERLMDHRMHKVEWGAGQPRRRTSAANWRQPVKWNAQPFVVCNVCRWRGELLGYTPDELGLAECPSCAVVGRLAKARRRVFCASLADVFDNEVDPAWRADLFALIDKTPHLDWLLLTKRVGNVRAMLDEVSTTLALRETGAPWPPRPNLWLGATVVTQEEADRDIQKLLAVPAAKRFLSIEPMLGPIDLDASPAFDGHYIGGLLGANDRMLSAPRIDWVICGGESGPQARPMHPHWVRALRDQCSDAGVPFHFKQWGEFLPADADEADPVVADVPDSRLYWSDGSKWDRFDGQRGGVSLVARVGTKAAGRLLDGVEHNGWPA